MRFRFNPQATPAKRAVEVGLVRAGENLIGTRQSLDAKQRSAREAVLAFSWEIPHKFRRPARQRGKKILGWEELGGHLLARALGIQPDYLNNMLRGKVAMSMGMVKRAAQELGWPTFVFLVRLETANELRMQKQEKDRANGKVSRWYGGGTV